MSSTDGTDHQRTTLRDVDLGRFFHPRRVAVVGASDAPGRPNTGIWNRLLAWSKEVGADIHPVNPGRDTVGGLPCVPSIHDVPGEIDVAALLVSDAGTALAEAVDRKVAFAVVFASGYAELGEQGRSAQDQLAATIAGSDTRLLGPNTNLNAFESFRRDIPGGKIALVTQSGHQGRPIFQAQELGIGVNHWAPTGNEVDLELADFTKWFADRPDTAVIAAYVEGFKDGHTLVLAADHAARRGVPIVCVKVGRTDVGAAVAASHTGKLTGADDIISAAFRQYGVTRVDGLDELLDVSQLMARYPSGPVGAGGDGVVVYAISGGTGAHMADLCTSAGLRLPRLPDDLQQQLHTWIPDYLHVANPVDNGGHPVGDERGRKILDTLVAHPDVGVLVCPITGAFPPMSDRLAQDLVDVAETTDKPICVIWGSPVGTEPAYRDILLSSSKLAVFRTFSGCVRAIRAWQDWHDFRKSYRSPFTDPRPAPALGPRAKAGAVLAGRTALSEHLSKEVLTAYGIPTTREEVVTSAAAAVRASRYVGDGRPVVLKASGSHLAHKSDEGGVRVSLSGEKAVRRAFAELSELSGGEVLVSELVDDGVVEVVVGASQDPLFGPAVMVGLGGVLVEVLRDVTFRVPPFGGAEARRMIGELAGKALLDGVRGRPAADTEALVDIVLKVQALAVDLVDEVAEVDINPLVLRSAGTGAVALDALVIPR